jgi:hypothetical protein
MNRMRITLALLLLFAFAGCGGDSSPTGTDGPVGFTEVFRDKASGRGTRGAEVISRQDRWGEVWNELMSTRSPKPPLPPVNFDTSILILAALGETPDSCRDVRIDQVNRSAGVLEVTISDVRSPPSCSCPPVVIQPVHVVAVPRAASGANYTWRNLIEGQPCN